MTEEMMTRAVPGQLLPPPERCSTEDGGVLSVPVVPVPVDAQWVWTPQQPYLLRLDIAQDQVGDRRVTWDLSRDLVQMGLVSADPVGDGDVVLWSTASDLHVQLDSPNGTALLRWPRSVVSAVLAETLHRRPNGMDAPDVDEVENWLAAFSLQNDE